MGALRHEWSADRPGGSDLGETSGWQPEAVPGAGPWAQELLGKRGDQMKLRKTIGVGSGPQARKCLARPAAPCCDFGWRLDGRDMAQSIQLRKPTILSVWIIATLLATGLLAGLGGSPASAATKKVTAVNGSAFGYWAHNISLFGGAQPDTGPTPTVTLASNAGNSPQTASAPSGTVVYGPAYLFTSDGITVSTSGTLGSSGFARSSTSMTNVNKATTQPSVTGSEIVTADSISSTCNASTSGNSGSTTTHYTSVGGFDGGAVLQTDSGLDVNGDGDYLDAGEHPPVNVAVGQNPGVNATYYGHIHLSSTSTDNFKVVFNEQSTSGTTRTVNAVHEYFGVTSAGNDPNSTLRGELIAGRSVCGVTVR